MTERPCKLSKAGTKCETHNLLLIRDEDEYRCPVNVHRRSIEGGCVCRWTNTHDRIQSYGPCPVHPLGEDDDDDDE